MSEKILLGIGKKIRYIRQEKELKLHQVAVKAGVSKSLLSKIENSRTLPSLPVLIAIIQALEVDFGYFFEDIERTDTRPFIHLRKDAYTQDVKEDAVGFTYHHILSKPASGVVLEAVLLEIAPNSQREKVSTDGHEFKYVLSGQVDYWIDQHEVCLQKGDSLFFDGRIPHVPVNNYDEPCLMLVIYLLSAS
jgi:transcriptional regulator with XRE-family HTH domain